MVRDLRCGDSDAVGFGYKAMEYWTPSYRRESLRTLGEGRKKKIVNEGGDSTRLMSLREFIEDLKKQGYSLKFNVSVRGKSGTPHHVDLLAENKRAGRKGKKIIGLEKRREGNSSFEIIRTFSIAYDLGAEPCYIVDKRPENEEDKMLLERYNMKLILWLP